MSQGTSGALLPVGWGTTVGTSPITVLPPNPSRQGLIFTNQSPTAVIAICPAVVNVGAFGVYAAAAAGTPGINQPGSITMNPGDKFIIDNHQLHRRLECCRFRRRWRSHDAGVLKS